MDFLEAEGELLPLLRGGLARIHSEMAGLAPYMEGKAAQWMRGLTPTGREEDYFRSARSLLLLLPWWLEKAIRGEPDLEFHRQVVYSTTNAYYYVRLVDDVMDGGGREEARLLPAGSFFLGEFQGAYRACFPPGHEFWGELRAQWAAMEDATVRDAALQEPTESDFMSVTARKSGGAKIPLAAVCHRYDRLDLREPWFAFYDLLARRQQLLDDLLDWRADLAAGVHTWVLAEAERRRAQNESASTWMVRAGFAWAADLLLSWTEDLQARAGDLESPGLLRYLVWMHTRSRVELHELKAASRGVARLQAALESAR